MLLTEPPNAPHTLPLPSTVATEVLLLVHVPPVTPSVRVIIDPVHTDDKPKIAPGAEFTVTTIDAVHPPSV